MSDIITNTTSTNKSKVFNVYVSKSTTAGTALVTRGSLNKTDTAPTVAGLYILEETGIYPNLGNIDAQAGKLNFASFDGTTWSKVEVDITNSIVDNGGQNISFSPNIYFNKNLAIASKTINAPITFVPTVNGDTILGGSTLVRLIADGTNAPNFSNFKKLNGSQNYSNIAGTLNACYFFYDGIDAWVNIWQGIGSSNIVTNDTTPPTAPTLSSSNIIGNSVNLSWLGATDNVGVTSYEIYKDGVLIDTVSASPYTVTGLSNSTTYAFTIKAKDASENSSASSNSVSVTTNSYTIPTFTNVMSGFTTESQGVYKMTSARTGGVANEKLIGDGYLEFGAGIKNDVIFALDTDSTVESYTNGSTFVYSVFVGVASYSNVYYVSWFGQNPGSLVFLGSKSDIQKFRLSRTGTTIKLLKSTDGVNFTDAYTFPNPISGQLWIKLSSINEVPAKTTDLKLVNL